MARFDDKVEIVTGAVSGISEGTARRFAAEGAKLVLGDKDAAGLEKIGTDLGKDNVALLTDISDFGTCEALVALAIEQFGRVNVLINDAGVGHLGKIDEGDLAEFDKVIDTDPCGTVCLSRAAIAALREA